MSATVLPFRKPAPKRLRSIAIPLDEVLAHLERTASILAGLGEVCRDDAEIRQAMSAASASVRRAGSILPGKA